jgi:hypothetical protein
MNLMKDILLKRKAKAKVEEISRPTEKIYSPIPN